MVSQNTCPNVKFLRKLSVPFSINMRIHVAPISNISSVNFSVKKESAFIAKTNRFAIIWVTGQPFRH